MHDRLEYVEERDDDGHLHGYLAIWPQEEEKEGARVLPLPRRPLDRPSGWRASLEAVFELLRQLDWQMTGEEHELLAHVTKEWAPGLLDELQRAA